MAGKSNFGRFYALRLIIAFAVVGLMLTIMGFIELGKDIGGSFRDFSEMKLTDFKPGDIIHGTIKENLGQAAYITTTEYTFVFKTDSYTSAGYYVIPFYSSLDAVIPDKLMLYRTGNKTQMSQLETLEAETDSYYFGKASNTYTRIVVDRAEVKSMDAEEQKYFREYIEEYVDWFYEGQRNIDSIKSDYISRMVPYVVQYNAGGGNWMLTVGLIILVLMAVVFVIYLVRKNKGDTAYKTMPYIPPTGGNTFVPYQNSNTPQYRNGVPVNGTQPPQSGDTLPRQGGSVPPYMQNNGGNTAPNGRTYPYMGGSETSGSGSSVPPYMNNGQQSGKLPTQVSGNIPNAAEVNRILNSPSRSRGGDPSIDDILNHKRGTSSSANQGGIFNRRHAMFSSQTEKDKDAFTSIIGATSIGRLDPKGYDGNFYREMPPIDNSPNPQQPQQNNIYGSSVPPFVPPTRAPQSDTMPSVNPHTEENIDLSNGGTAVEDRAATYRAVMPHNGDIPVVNPNRSEADAAFADSLKEITPEPPKAPETPAAAPIPEPVANEPIMVEPTDPSIRNLYNIGGHQMETVDPLTETNVDLSNGGIEKVVPEPEPVPEPIPEPAPAPEPKYIAETLPDFETFTGVQDIPTVQDVAGVQDIPRVQDIPTVQDVPKVDDFPTVPDYSQSYARPEFPQAPTFPDKIETPEFPQAPKFPE